MKKLLISFIAIFTLLLIAGCGAKDETEKDHARGKSDERLKKITVMLDWYPNAVHSYLYAAKEKGYFKDEGLDVEFEFPANPTDPLSLAASGKVTMGMYYQPDVIMARANEDIPVKAVAAVVRSPLNRLVYETKTKIKSPKDLEGKNVGYSGIPVAEKMIETMVKKDGGDPAKVKMTDVGFDLMPALVSGKTDAVTGMYVNHEVPILESEKHDVGVLNPEDYGVPSYYELVAVTSDATLKKEKKQIEAFWRAAEKGFNFTVENPEQSLEILLDNQDKSNFPLDATIEKKSLEILLPKMKSDKGFGSQEKSSWEETAKWLKDYDLIKKEPEATDVYVNIAE
ncbi:ABC transporter substrate-binding protein [Aciduricibacillus chroicocephali]|uniref:ABC transporter substrate-binding protein n=1 Tax=Aciduricibacillus chroicocephali TaxID=3054939 RepID=A0ABY9KWF2_9BACI|nr:ABC transporter substrate-binding protein [Bacillaceae bacterium 44XB]